MKLLIGSVYKDHERSIDWYNLQIKYLKRYTEKFDHLVCLNGSNNFYENSKVLFNKQSNNSQQDHCIGLNLIIKYFNDNDFDQLLILDSDCFPFNDWYYKINSNSKDFDICSIVRYENLDNFAHPSAFFIKKKMYVEFGLNKIRNIIGKEFLESSSNIQSFFPLIRTNKINYHQLLCGVYFDCFYHHGAGSRQLNFRISEYKKEDKDLILLEKSLYEKLIANTDNFLNSICHKNISRKILC